MAEKKKVKVKLKKREEGATPSKPPTTPSITPSTATKTTPPKITFKGLKISIEEIKLGKKK